MERKKQTKKRAAVQKKTCMKCSDKRALTDFYVNKGNKDGYFKDYWCKNCFDKYVVDMTTLKEYCYFNNRVFNPDLYHIAELDADVDLVGDPEYEMITDTDKKLAYRFKKIRSCYVKKMNLSQYYEYVNNNLEAELDIKVVEQDIYDSQYAELENTIKDMAAEDFDENNKIFDPVWYGEFNKRQLDFLNDYYDKLSQQFEITDVHMEDMFREVAKSALEKNEAFLDYSRGEPTAHARYTKACDMFIKLSDQSKLSAKTRSASDRVGFSDLGSLIKRIENQGALMRKQEFPEDEVDRIINDFMWTLASFDGENLNEEVRN